LGHQVIKVWFWKLLLVHVFKGQTVTSLVRSRLGFS